MYIADLHIHSKYSRATSKDLDPSHLDLWSRYKGIGLVGTGDFTHGLWRQELRRDLVRDESGFYSLRRDSRIESTVAGDDIEPRFVVSGEISSIYKKNGKTRKVHNVILLPDLECADLLSRRLEAIGNIHSDGRPILGLDCRDLLELTLETCPEALFIPAHIWTPHFSLFGAFSGFDSIEECFQDLTPYIHCVETGLSSDPPMNWRVSALDGLTLVSNSDAHSPGKLGREANILEGEMSYSSLVEAIVTGRGFGGTLEFFPEEGKYHWDGHRNCGCRLSPEETLSLGGICPYCGKKITIGVEHRVEELADRPRGYRPGGAKDFSSLIPLPEIIGAVNGVSAASKKSQQKYLALLGSLGSEFYILRQAPIEDIARFGGSCLAEGIARLRRGEVKLIPGYDGEYGKISLFTPQELEELRGEQTLFAVAWEEERKKEPPKFGKKEAKASLSSSGAGGSEFLNREQEKAVKSQGRSIAVIAGPGTGKTKTLVERILYLIKVRGVSPSEITAVTFTNQAAAEMKARLALGLGGKKGIKGITVGTFHAVALNLIPPKHLADDSEVAEILEKIQSKYGEVKKAREKISRIKNGLAWEDSDLPRELYDAYNEELLKNKARDLDDILLEALSVETIGRDNFHYLLVDEFQDINPLQHDLVKKWSDGGNLFVIGDPDQAIYGFRGADSRCFAKLCSWRDDLEVISLVKNYRSTPEIIRSGLKVINNNPGGARCLESVTAGGSVPRCGIASSLYSESLWLASEINCLTGGIDMLSAEVLGHNDDKVRSFSDIAVLCRTRSQLKVIEDCFSRQGIPCVIIGRDDYLESDSVRGCLSFFRSLLWPEDIQSLKTALSLLWDFPEDMRSKAALVYSRLSKPDVEILRESLGSFGLWELWYQAIAAWGDSVRREKPQILLEQWLSLYGGGDEMTKALHTAVFYDKMADFLTALTLGSEGDIHRASRRDYSGGAVRLSTLHGAKGLEFPVVFVAGLGHGIFPPSQTDCGQLEEERRLFFVGLTRAKEELIITGEDSCFIKELSSVCQSFPIKSPRPKKDYTQGSLF